MISTAPMPKPAFTRDMWLDRIGIIACLLIPWLLIFSRAGGDTVSSLLGALFLFRCWQHRNWAWLSDPVIRLCIIAWAWMLLVATPFAHDRGESLKTALPWIRWWLLYAALAFWVLADAARLRLAALNIGVMMCLVMVDTLWQYLTGISLTGHAVHENYRLTGPMDNVKVGIFMAKLCFPAAAILLYQAMKTANRRHIWGGIIWLGCCLGTVLISGERTAFFSCLLLLGVFTTIIVMTEPALRAKSLLAFAAVVCVFLVLLAMLPTLQARLSWLQENLSNFQTSSYGTLARIGIQMGADHWATGAGFKGFRELCPTYLAPGELDQCNIHPHNPYIEWFAELGAPGLLLFIAIIAAMLLQAFRALRTGREADRILPAFIVGILALHFFPLMATQSFFSNWPALLLWYSVAIAMASLNMLKSPPETSL